MNRYHIPEPLRSKLVNEVRTRLQRYDCWAPRNCLIASAVATAALRANGFRAAFQAGSTFLRRAPERSGDPDREMFGGGWNPEHTVSAVAVAQGRLPEYHAWCGVTAVPAGCPPIPGKGLIVDFGAWMIEGMCKECGFDWEWERPGIPLVIPLAESVSNRYYYEPVPEACLMLAVVLRRMLARLHREGRLDISEVEDLFPCIGGPRAPVGKWLDGAEPLRDNRKLLQLVRLGAFGPVPKFVPRDGQDQEPVFVGDLSGSVTELGPEGAA